MKGWAPGVANDATGKPRQMAGQPFNQRTRRSRQPPASATTTTPPTSRTSSTPRRKDKPWCFWYGAVEPHRGYEYGSGVAKGGKKLADIDRVPGCWPDNEVVRNDLLDYAFEVEHFDRHLGRMLALLEQRGLLDNTLVVVTVRQRHAVPARQGPAYREANHLPLAIDVAERASSNRAASCTITSASSTSRRRSSKWPGSRWDQTGMAPATGRSLTDLFAGPPGHRTRRATTC